MQLNMNSRTPGISGVPIPNRPNLSTHAIMDMSSTFFIPNRFMQKGTSRKQSVSDICDSESRAFEFLTANVSAIAELDENELRKVLA